jgi:predicted nucleic acid-binding Zn ribbon protein
MRPINVHLDSKLTAQTRRLEQMTLILKSRLPPECDGHYHVASIRDDTVVIITDSPVWTTRLRQLGPLILQSLANSPSYSAHHSAHSSTRANSIQQQLHHVRIVSRYGPIPDHHQPRTVKRTISQQSRQQIAQTASYISDKKLKNALLKISRHGKN